MSYNKTIITVLCSIVLAFSTSYSQVVKNGLVLELDAGESGGSPGTFWKPKVGPIDGGAIVTTGFGSVAVLGFESNSGAYVWFYYFDNQSWSNTGQVIELGDSDTKNLNFDYDQVKGKISILRVYDRVLDSSEISGNYDTGLTLKQELPPLKPVSTDGLVLEMDAASPGVQYDYNWEPSLGGPYKGGVLAGLGDGQKPLIAGCQHPDSLEKYLWYYKFASNATNHCGQVQYLGESIDFDYDQDFTISVWVRMTESNPETYGRGVFMSNQSDGYNGYRLGSRNYSTGYWRPEFVMRDNSTPLKALFQYQGSLVYPYSDQWYHISVVYDGHNSDFPSVDLYVNGEYVVNNPAQVVDENWFTDPDFMVSGNASIGSGHSDGTYPLNGDISVVRVYERCLDADEILNNYLNGLDEKDHQPPEVIVSDGLVYSLECSVPGHLPEEKVVPLIGSFNGANIEDIALTGDKPQFLKQTDPLIPSHSIWYYRFTASDELGGGRISGVGDDISFEPWDDFSIEMWFRAGPPEAINNPDCGFDPPEDIGRRMYLFGDMDESRTGYRLSSRQVGSNPDRFYLELMFRDNLGSEKRQIKLDGWKDGSGQPAGMLGQWYHVAVTSDGDSGGNQLPVINFYKNGEFDSGGTANCYIDSGSESCDCPMSEADFLPYSDQPLSNPGTIGARGLTSSPVSSDSRMYYIGDVGALRIYDRVLDGEEISNNYRVQRLSVDETVSDITGDDIINNDDFGCFAGSWLTREYLNSYDIQKDFNKDNVINFQDLAILSYNWISESEIKFPGPYKILFSNDSTNVALESPWHQGGESTRELIYGAIDETSGTGIDAHMLQPGIGWTPYWPSRHLPMKEHYDWFYDTYGINGGNLYPNYVLGGGDVIEDFVPRAHLGNMGAIVSFRLNDSHHLQYLDDNPPPGGRIQELNKFYYDHPEYRILDNINIWDTRVHNWVHPEAREYKFKFLVELCENYDIDGLELDFMRHCNFFKDEPVSLRKSIMKEFLTDVRRLLNRTSGPGQHRWLCVRIPAFISSLDYMGLDLDNMIDAGVDMFNLSCYYHTVQQTDIARFRSQLPDDALIYLEVHYAVGYEPASGLQRLTTDEMFYTAAHLAYEDGADGMSVFNFVYYRLEGYEPPFRVFENMADPDWIAQQKQHYVISRVFDQPHNNGYQLPRTFDQSTETSFNMRMAPPLGGWSSNGRLRIEGSDSLGSSSWTAKINGNSLVPTSDVSEPYDNPYPVHQGNPDQYRAWVVPDNLLINGNNSINIKMDSSSNSESIIYLDLIIE